MIVSHKTITFMMNSNSSLTFRPVYRDGTYLSAASRIDCRLGVGEHSQSSPWHGYWIYSSLWTGHFEVPIHHDSCSSSIIILSSRWKNPMVQWMNTSASVRALTEKPLNLWQMRANINLHCWPLQFDIFPSPLWNSPYQPLWELKILSSASLSMLLNRIADKGEIDTWPHWQLHYVLFKKRCWLAVSQPFDTQHFCMPMLFRLCSQQ